MSAWQSRTDSLSHEQSRGLTLHGPLQEGEPDPEKKPFLLRSRAVNAPPVITAKPPAPSRWWWRFEVAEPWAAAFKRGEVNFITFAAGAVHESDEQFVRLEPAKRAARESVSAPAGQEEEFPARDLHVACTSRTFAPGGLMEIDSGEGAGGTAMFRIMGGFYSQPFVPSEQAAREDYGFLPGLFLCSEHRNAGGVFALSAPSRRKGSFTLVDGACRERTPLQRVTFAPADVVRSPGPPQKNRFPGARPLAVPAGAALARQAVPNRNSSRNRGYGFGLGSGNRAAPAGRSGRKQKATCGAETGSLAATQPEQKGWFLEQYGDEAIRLSGLIVERVYFDDDGSPVADRDERGGDDSSSPVAAGGKKKDDAASSFTFSC